MRVGLKGTCLLFWRDTIFEGWFKGKPVSFCWRDTIIFEGWFKGTLVFFLEGYNPSVRIGLKEHLSVFGSNTIRL